MCPLIGGVSLVIMWEEKVGEKINESIDSEMKSLRPVWFVDGFRLGFGFKCKVIDYKFKIIYININWIKKKI